MSSAINKESTISNKVNETQNSNLTGQFSTSNGAAILPPVPPVNPAFATNFMTDPYAAQYAQYYNPALASAYMYNPALAYTAAATQLPTTTALSNPAIPYAYPYPAYPYNYAATIPSTVQAVDPKAVDPKVNKNEKNQKINKQNKKAKNDEEQSNELSEDDDPTIDNSGKSKNKNNVLPFCGNSKTMNLNQLILTNILNSPYFKQTLYQLKTYHEVIDEIYYQVSSLEPWERGSRKVSGQTGMCGSVRGVSAGGIVSTAFCILYKLYTLKLTRKQLTGLLKHKDSPYIRALGFLYIRFTQPPDTFWDWYKPYLEDEEELEIRSGITMTIGELCRHMLTKLEWYTTFFPRMPVPVQKELEKKLQDYDRNLRKSRTAHLEDGELDDDKKYDKNSRNRTRSKSIEKRERKRSRSRSRDYKRRSRERSRHHRSRSRSNDRYRRR